MRWAALLLGLLLAGPALAQDPAAEAPEAAAEALPLPEVELDIRPREITVGDPVAVEIVLLFPPGSEAVEPRMPAWQESWGGAEVLRVGETDSFRDSSGRRVVRQQVILTAFETGSVRLPPLEISLPFAVRTVEVQTPEGGGFEVVSVLPEGEEEIEPKGAAAPLARGGDARFPLTAAGLFLLVAAAAWRLLRRLARTAGAGARFEHLDPYEELRRRLSRLDPAAGAEPTHTGISLALRRYLGRSLGFPGVESTTSEIQRRLRDAPLPLDLGRETLELLRASDQVKFARAEVDPATTGRRLAGTEGLARQIEATLNPAEEAAEAAEAGA